MKENYYALLIAIVAEKSASKSLEEMGFFVEKKEKTILNLDKNDIKLILFLKEQHTWDEIADMCGVSQGWICSLVKKFKSEERN